MTDLLDMVREAVITGPDGVVVGDITALHFFGNTLVIETDIELIEASGDPDGGEEMPVNDALSSEGQQVGSGPGPHLVLASGTNGH